MDTDLRSEPDRGQGLRLGEDLGVGANANLKVSRPRALSDKYLLESQRIRRARPDVGEVVADDRNDGLAHRLRFSRIAACLFLDDPLKHTGDESYPTRLDRLQVAGSEEPRRAVVAPVPGRVGKRRA